MNDDISGGKDAEETRIYSEKVTTDVAAKSLGVTPRTIRTYIEQGKLQATAQGEGVEKTWLVSVESLRSLRAARNNATQNPRSIREAGLAESAVDDLFREVTERLEVRAAEVGELRVRLEMMEQSESALREERKRLIQDVKREQERANQERGRAEEAQQTAEQLVEECQRVREEARWLREELEAERRKGFWRGLFGG